MITFWNTADAIFESPKRMGDLQEFMESKPGGGILVAVGVKIPESFSEAPLRGGPSTLYAKGFKWPGGEFDDDRSPYGLSTAKHPWWNYLTASYHVFPSPRFLICQLD